MLAKILFGFTILVAISIDSTTAGIEDYEMEFMNLIKQHPEGYAIFQKTNSNIARKCMDATTFSAVFGGAVSGFPSRWAAAKNAGGAVIAVCLPKIIEEYKAALKDNNYGGVNRSRSISRGNSFGRSPSRKNSVSGGLGRKNSLSGASQSNRSGRGRSPSRKNSVSGGLGRKNSRSNSRG